MGRYDKCIARIARAAGHQLTDSQVQAVFERIHQAALKLKKGEKPLKLGKRTRDSIGVLAHNEPAVRTAITEAAQYAMVEMVHEAELKLKQANLQVVKLGARQDQAVKLEQMGLDPLEAVKRLIARDYTGRYNTESLEQKVMGLKSYYGAKLVDTWQALGDDFLGYFQDQTKLLTLVRELRGEDTKDPIAKKGAEAFHEAAEEARIQFNDAGGDIGKLDDWGMPQHHSQQKVASAGDSADPNANRQAWVDAVLPLLDRGRYVDDLGTQWPEAQLREFLGKAWDNIATDGWASVEPGARGGSKVANRHSESRQIHFKDADSVISYWERFGERTAAEILLGHIDTMARDIAFVESFGPNPNTTYQTVRDTAMRKAAMRDPRRTKDELEAKFARVDELWNYAAGKTGGTANVTVSHGADILANLNVAGKLGGASIASFFGDKPMMEAVAHLNNIPAIDRWRMELSTFNPANGADRRQLQRQGLMLESIRSVTQRFYDGLGKADTTGKLANAVMRMTGMQAVNDFRKAAFSASLLSAIGHEVASGKAFKDLADSDVRTLRTYGITETEWNVWRLAKLEDIKMGSTTLENNLTPSAIEKVTDDQLKAANVIGQADGPEAADAARRAAIVKLLGAVNTEGDFAIVTPGWNERALFYGSLRRGTVAGEISRSVLQFKSFPWAYYKRAMDAIANADGPAPKAAMVAWILITNTLAGAMVMQVREMLAGKDPRPMVDENWWKFWPAAFLQGGALGIYGDFLSSVNQTRYGSGPLEVMAGPTMGPILEMGLVQPMNAAKKAIEGKETHLGAQTVQDLKGFIPGNNVWYAKAALEHLVWMQVMEALSPGYLQNIRRRTEKDYHQDWWWEPGELVPERAPDVGAAVRQ